MDVSRLARHNAIQEVSEPITPVQRSSPSPTPLQSSDLTDLLRKSLSQHSSDNQQDSFPPELVVGDIDIQSANEQTPLLLNGHKDSHRPTRYSSKDDLEGQFATRRWRRDWLNDSLPNAKHRGLSAFRSAFNPKLWTPHSLWHNAVLPSAKTIPSVILGLLLNILDALSYGFILFPLGSEIFSATGPDGIAIFYVSCIVSQLVYSCGASIFKGGVGSEMVSRQFHPSRRSLNCAQD